MTEMRSMRDTHDAQRMAQLASALRVTSTASSKETGRMETEHAPISARMTYSAAVLLGLTTFL